MSSVPAPSSPTRDARPSNPKRRLRSPLVAERTERWTPRFRIARRLATGGVIVSILGAVLLAAFAPRTSYSSGGPGTVSIYATRCAGVWTVDSTPPECTSAGAQPAADNLELVLVTIVMDNVPRPGLSPLDAVYPEPVVRETSVRIAGFHHVVAEAAGKPAMLSAGELGLTTGDVDALNTATTAYVRRVLSHGADYPPVGVVRYNVQWEMLLGKPLFVLGILSVVTFVLQMTVAFIVQMGEGMRHALGPYACPRCDFDLRDTPVTDSGDRICPECAWKGRV